MHTSAGLWPITSTKSGNYTTHVYVDYVDGGVEGFSLGQAAFIPVRQ